MISENPTLYEVIRHAIETDSAEHFKILPGIVTAYDPLSNTAFVKPATKHARYSSSTGERSFLEMSEIPFVPVAFPRAAGMVMRMPMGVGDHVLLAFCDTSLAEYRATGAVSEPEDARKHSIGWPVAFPGFFPDCKPMSPVDAAAVALGQMIVGEDGGRQMRIGPTGIEFAPAGVTPIMRVALAPALLTLLNAIVAAIAAQQASIMAIAANPLLGIVVPPVASGAATTILATGTTMIGTTLPAAVVTGNAAIPSTLVRAV